MSLSRTYAVPAWMGKLLYPSMGACNQTVQTHFTEAEVLRMVATFEHIDLNRNGLIDCFELQNALAVSYPCVDVSVARMLIKLFDTHSRMQINFDEFLLMHRFLEETTSTRFAQFDANQDNYLDIYEVSRLLASFDMTSVSDETLRSYMAFVQPAAMANPLLDRTHFLHLLCLLVLTKRLHELHDNDGDGVIQLTLEKFAILALYLRS
jgi:Ca2+-binding EF-hand superfamily protein